MMKKLAKIISENLKSGWTIDRISTVDLSLLKLSNIRNKIHKNTIQNYNK